MQTINQTRQSTIAEIPLSEMTEAAKDFLLHKAIETTVADAIRETLEKAAKSAFADRRFS